MFEKYRIQAKNIKCDKGYFWVLKVTINGRAAKKSTKTLTQPQV